MFTVWIVFILNIYFTNHYLLKESFGKDPLDYALFLPILLTIILIDLIASIFVTVSFENKNYYFYLTGLIMASIFNLLNTIILLIYDGAKDSENYKKTIRFLILIVQIIMIWSQTIILIIYCKSVKSLFNNPSYLNANLINKLPKESQP